MDEANREGRVAWLDGLKGVAMLWIVLNHLSEKLFGYPFIANPSPDWPPLAERVDQLLPLAEPGALGFASDLVRWVGWFGDQGVQLFLIASGFALTWAMLHKADSARAFYKKRLFRIFPVWWAAHIAVLVVGYLFSQGWMYPTDRALLPSLLGLRITPSLLYYGSPSWWYVGLLLQLYAVFPLLWWWQRRRGVLSLLFLSIVIAVLVRGLGLLAPGAWMDAILRGAVFPSRLPEFVFGMALASWMMNDREQFSRRLTHPLSLIGAVALWIVASLASLTSLGMIVAPMLTGVADFVVLHAVLLLLRGRAWSWLGWIGIHSYAIYLLHHPWIDAFVPAGGGGLSAGGLLFLIVITCVAVLLSSRVLELITDKAESTARKSWPSHKLALGARVVALGILSLVAILGAEGLVRRLDPQEVLGWGERPALQAHDEYGWTLKPGVHTRLRWEGYDYEVQATEDGFAMPACADPRPAGALRILTLGDAFTSAEGVEPSEAWPRRLQGNLEAALTGGEVEVCNFAVTGHGPRQYAAIARDYVPRLKPDLVIVGLFANDFADVLSSDEEFHASIGFGNADPDSWKQWLRFLHLRRWLEMRVVDRFADRWLGERDSRGWYLSNLDILDRTNDSVEAEGARLVEEHLGSVKNIAQANDAKLLVLLLPAPTQVASADELDYLPHNADPTNSARFDPNRPQRVALGIASRLSLRTLDLRPALTGAPARTTFFPDNMHWQPDAHRRVAEFVAERIVSLYLLD